MITTCTRNAKGSSTSQHQWTCSHAQRPKRADPTFSAVSNPEASTCVAWCVEEAKPGWRVGSSAASSAHTAQHSTGACVTSRKPVFASHGPPARALLTKLLPPFMPLEAAPCSPETQGGLCAVRGAHTSHPSVTPSPCERVELELELERATTASALLCCLGQGQPKAKVRVRLGKRAVCMRTS
jgi:hypothetical protein